MFVNVVLIIVSSTLSISLNYGFFYFQSGDGDTAGFHIPAGKSKGVSAVAGFTLKF